MLSQGANTVCFKSIIEQQHVFGKTACKYRTICYSTLCSIGGIRINLDLGAHFMLIESRKKSDRDNSILFLRS